MSIRPAISVPLPWLTILAGRFYPGKRSGTRTTFLRLPRSLSITREGRWFIGVLFLIGLAAINTGNNLLYLVVATLLSLIVISGVMSESVLRGVTVTRTLPRHIYKGVPARSGLQVENTKRFLPSFSLIFKEEGLPVSTSAYILKLPPRATTTLHTSLTFTRRGRHVLPGIRVLTRFPFGIFLKGKVERTEDEVTVYPSIKPVTPSAIRTLSARSEGRGKAGKGHGTQLYNLRRYTYADDARFIHWRSLARTRKLFVKEFEREEETTVTVVFDNRTRRGGETVFEDTVDEAAGLISHFIEKGSAVGLRTNGSEVEPAPGQGQLERLLTVLAHIGPEGGEGEPGITVA